MRNPNEEDVPWTDWSKMTVGQMWEAIGEFDRQPASEQSGGWNRAFELLDAHRARLEEYRDLVERSWRSPSADAFVRRVNDLIASVVVARDAAVANEPVLPHLSSSMVEARAALAPLHEKWTANQARVAAGGAPAVAGGMQRGSNAPVPDDVLHRQAVSVMQTLSSRLLEGYRAIKIPPIDEIPISDPDPGGWRNPPASSGSGQSAGGSWARPASSSGAPVPVGRSPGGPVLSGAPVPPPPIGSVPGGGSPPPGAPSVPGVPPVVGPVIGVMPPGVGGGEVWPGRSPAGGGSQWSTPGRRGLPPGGVINGPPEGMIEPSRPGPGVRRATPAGGIIGPTTGRETEGMFAPPVSGASGGRSGQRQLRSNPAYYTDEHWQQPKGVPPVLGPTEPEPEPTHDPGMPVIGMEPREPREARESDWSRQYRERRDR
jgi:hypothetical protein